MFRNRAAFGLALLSILLTWYATRSMTPRQLLKAVGFCEGVQCANKTEFDR